MTKSTSNRKKARSPISQSKASSGRETAVAIKPEEPDRTRPGGHTITIKESIERTAVEFHAPHMLARGPMQRAVKSRAKGHPVARAASDAAVQGKGYVAEGQHSIAYSLDAGMKGVDSHCQPNTCSNAPHADLFVRMPDGSKQTVQVGVGKSKYLRQKSRKTRAQVLVVNKDAVAPLSAQCGPGDARPTDRIENLGASSTPRSAKESEDVANSVMAERLNGSAPTRGDFVARATLRGGLESAGLGGLTTLCFEVFDRVAKGTPCDGTVIRNALQSAWDSFLSGALQSYILAQYYFDKAKAAIDGLLVSRIGKAIPWAGALADFLIAVGKDIVRFLQGQIGFTEVLRRAAIKAIEVLCVAGCVTAVLAVFASSPMILLALLALGAAWLASRFGKDLGESLFGQTPRVAPLPAR